MISSISNSLNFGSQMGVQSMQQFKEKMFSKIDSDGSGGIDKTEFSDLAKKMSEMSGSSPNVEDVYSKYDANGDKSLSMDEMDSFMKDNAPTPPPVNGLMGGQGMQNPLEDLLSKIDSDSDGSINKSEFEDFAKHISERTGESTDVDDVFSTYDTDGDNSLSMDEMDSFMKDNAPTPPAGMQNAMSTYGMNMGQDQMSSLLDLLNNQSSDSKSGDTDSTNSIKDYISKLLETLGNKAGSGDTYSLVNFQA